MNDTIERIGLKFFGTITATLSHELKNRLSVIKENAGLLKDLSAMARQGRDLDSNRLDRLAQVLSNQVALADALIQNMNRLAHSVDEVVRSVDLADVLALSAAFSQRSAQMHRVHLEISTSEDTHTVTTSPFFLVDLLWSCLRVLIHAANQDQTIGVSLPETSEDGCLIRMSAQREDVKSGKLSLPQDISHLAEALETRLSLEPKKGILLVHVPWNITGFSGTTRSAS